jgi:L-arabinose isomerase
VSRVKIGVFSIGLAAYWHQFPGLEPRLSGYGHFVATKLTDLGADVIDAGMVDDQPKALAAGDLFARENVDLVVCYVTTYSTSSQVVPAVQHLKRPVLILNLQPTAQLAYAKTGTAEWLANCQACCVPEISCAFERCGIDFQTVTGLLGLNAQTERALANEVTADHPAAKRAWREIEAWVKAAHASRSLERSRLGFLGHTYPGMLDMYSDFTQLTGAFGAHIEVLEMEDLEVRVQSVTEAEVSEKRAEIESIFEFAQANPNDPISLPPNEDALEWACRVAVGLDKLTKDFDLGGLAYYYRGLNESPFEQLGGALIVGCSLLTARGIPCSGEGDLKNLVAMKLMDSLGAGGSFTELYAMDFEDNIILMGHDGPFHLKIAEGKPMLRGLGLYHGKRGSGVSVEATVKHGPITITGLTQTRDGRMKLLVAEGECVPGEVLHIGNTNSRLSFGAEKGFDVATWMNNWAAQGPTHHVALGVGHVADQVRQFAKLRALECVVV